jgi:tetratricopeptide (TPR) repeat protein
MEANEYYNRGLYRFNNGDYTGAIEDWTSAIQLNPNYVLAYNKRAWAYDKTGKADKAIADWEAVLRIDPAHNTAKQNLKNACLARGVTRYNKEDYDRAIADFSRAVELDPDDIGAYNNRGSARFAKEDYNGVIEDFTQIIRLDQTNAIVYYNRGCAYSHIGDYDRAVADFEAALKIDPDDTDIRMNLEKAIEAGNGKR